MKIACLCCTWNRPRQLGHLIRCFERQHYEDRELIILDDGGQYREQEGDRWRLYSIRDRFDSLAQKRNAVARYASPDVDAFAPWDDDDLYLPWALDAHARALERAEWSRPSIVLHPVIGDNGHWSFRQHRTGGLYHGGWAYTRAAFERVGGYPAGWSGPEDREFMRCMEAAGITQADPIALDWAPSYIYTWAEAGACCHISGMLTDAAGDQGEEAWRRIGSCVIEPAEVVPADPPWFSLGAPIFEPGIHERPF